MVCPPVRRVNSRGFRGWMIVRTGRQAMPYLICSMISSVDLARDGVSWAKDFGYLGNDLQYNVNNFFYRRQL